MHSFDTIVYMLINSFDCLVAYATLHWYRQTSAASILLGAERVPQGMTNLNLFSQSAFLVDSNT